MDLGFSLGLISKNIKSFLRFISALDIPTYEGKSVFFYDILTELAKNHILIKNVEVIFQIIKIECEEKWGEDIFFETNKCTERKMLEYSIMCRELLIFNLE